MIIRRDSSGLREDYDVVVIGGGITGAAVAREAAVRNLRVCLLEKNDFGWSTSAATSKLLHGGLRYLENYEFGIVRESLSERRVLGCAAGHLSTPLPFLLPIYKGKGRFTLRVGLFLYDLLSFDRNRGVPEDKKIPAHRWLSKEELLREEPRLSPDGLTGGFKYYDLQSLYPDRLTLAFVKSAVESGARVFNHTEVVGFETIPEGNGRRIRAAKVKDAITGKTAAVQGRVFVNASGPWLDIVLGLVEEKPMAHLQRSKGIHILTKPLLDKAVGFKTRAGGHFLTLPWQGSSLIGPTDTQYLDHPDKLAPTADDIRELVEDVNASIPGRPLKPEMIEHVIIGIRPLIASGKSTYRASRKSEMFDHAEENVFGMISVAGGKWTTSRRLGEDVVRHLLEKAELSGFALREVDTAVLPLYGSPGFATSATAYADFAVMEFRIPEISEDVHRHLVTLYGTEHTEIIELVKRNKSLAKRISKNPNRLDIAAQAVYAAENECALTLSDILCRRLSVGMFGVPDATAVKLAADRAAEALGWDAKRKRREISELKASFPNTKALLAETR